jgi:spermidine synthase
VSTMFEEIDYRETPIGALSLRRRRLRPDGEDIWEIKLDDGYLMSSQFVEGEISLSKLALRELNGDRLEVVVGGLGLGYTALAALEDPRVAEMHVVELIPEVIEWHQAHLLPLGHAVADDPRTRLVQGDFFALAESAAGFDEDNRGRRFDAVLVDIDHSTTHLIDESSAFFYASSGLAAMARQLLPGGIFGLWSSGDEDAEFLGAMRETFEDVRAERVEFLNPYLEEKAFNIIYLGRRPQE